MSQFEDPDYDEYDVLVDTDPLALRDRCRAAEREVALLRSVVFEACDVALVTVGDQPRYFGCHDAYEDWIESARFSPDQAAAVRRVLAERSA